jgi:hypothetical protein
LCIFFQFGNIKVRQNKWGIFLFAKKNIIIGTVLLIIGKFIDDKKTELLSSFHSFMAKPFALPWLTYEKEMNAWGATFQFVGLVFIYIFIILGIWFVIQYYFFNKKESNNNFCEDIEDKLTETLLTFEDKESLEIIDEKVTEYMTTKQVEIKRIFGIREKHIEFIWYYPINKNEIELVYLKEPKDHDNVAKLISSSLNVPEIRVYEPAVNERMEFKQSNIKQFISVRNCGNLKLGLAVFIYKENTFTEENLKEFIQYTTNLLLLGFHKPFVVSIKNKKRTS